MRLSNTFYKVLPGFYFLAGLLIMAATAYIGLHDYLAFGWLAVSLLLVGNGIHLHSLSMEKSAQRPADHRSALMSS
ncbi:MAG: hypothetical protein AAF290_13370 [Pseudomonadota bacterium]